MEREGDGKLELQHVDSLFLQRQNRLVILHACEIFLLTSLASRAMSRWKITVHVEVHGRHMSVISLKHSEFPTPKLQSLVDDLWNRYVQSSG